MSAESKRLGKYILRERLARGGQGEVWKAFDSQLRRFVAIKQLHADLQADPDFVSRFEREARFIASLRHPNIVQIHDFQVINNPDSDSTTAYMVMDYIEGPTLAEYIRNTSRKLQFPAAEDIVYIFTQVSLAIDYAHGKGMIHRDIKPANIMLDQRHLSKNELGLPTLTDFGIAKLQGGSDTSTVLGTPLYVSPEQASGSAGDKRSDLYSLGIILYEITTGVTPFRGDSLLAILMQHYQELPTPPALINPNIPPALSEVILKSIAKDPNARYSSASAMTIELAEALIVPVPAELLQSTDGQAPGSLFPSIDGANSPRRPEGPLGMTATPSAFTPASLDGQTSSTSPTEARPGMNTPAQASVGADYIPSRPVEAKPRTQSVTGRNSSRRSSPSPITFVADRLRRSLGRSPLPVGTVQEDRPVAPPTAPQQAPRQRKTLYIVLIALLVAILAGSGLLYALFARNGTNALSSANSVVGQVRFLSSSNAAPPGSIDEVQITIQHIPNPPVGEHYYAWLQVNSEGISPIHWLLTTQNGSLASSYTNPHLLTYRPYLLLITAETADNGAATFDPNGRFYYASLLNSIQNVATFDLRACPQGGSNNICFS